MNPNDAAKLALEKCSLRLIETIKNRIQSQGKNSNDSAFSPYSTDYKPRRTKNALQINYKDFTFSGGMFASFKVLGIETQNNVVTATFGMNAEKYEKIVASHSNREGGLIIAPSNSELENVARLFATEFIQNIWT